MRVFDFDNTIYDGESAFHFFLFSIKYKPSVLRFIPVVTYNLVRYKAGRMTMQDLEQGMAKYAHRYMCSFDDPYGLVSDFWDKHMHRIKSWYVPQPDDVIITASFDVIMEELCNRLGVQHCIASTIDRDAMTVTYINFNRNKPNRFRMLFGDDAVIDEFYTDNDFDKPMIDISRTAYLVKKNKITKIK